MPSREEIRRSVAAKMRRGQTRLTAQREAAEEFGVPLAEVFSVALFSGDAIGVTGASEAWESGHYSIEGSSD